MCSDQIRIVSTSITSNIHSFFVLEAFKIFSSHFIMCGKWLLTVTSLWCRASSQSSQLTESSFSLASSSFMPFILSSLPRLWQPPFFSWFLGDHIAIVLIRMKVAWATLKSYVFPSWNLGWLRKTFWWLWLLIIFPLDLGTYRSSWEPWVEGKFWIKSIIRTWPQWDDWSLTLISITSFPFE